MSQDSKPNHEPKTEEKPEKAKAKSSRMGKEAKIGLLVIVVLLAGLATAVFFRLRGSSSAEVATATATSDASKDKPASAAKADPFLTHSKSRTTTSTPTIVPAKSLATKPPKAVDSHLDKWKMPPGRAESRASSKPSSLDLPPVPPEPPKAAGADRYDRYASDSIMPPDVGAAPKPLRPNSNDAQLLAPEVSTPRADSAGSSMASSGRRGVGVRRDLVNSAEPSEFDAASAEPAPPVPSYRDNSRGDRATMPPPPPSRPGNSYSNPAGSSYAGSESHSLPASNVSQHEPYDYRNGSSGTGHSGFNSSRRSSASSSFSSAPRRDDGKYEIQPNDSYWTISEKVYGTGAYFKALMQLNRANSSGDERLQPGQLVSTPSVAELEKSYPDLCPKPSRRETLQSRASTVSSRPQYRSGRTYTVVEGDTLFNIARYELGKASRWAEIYELNRDVLGKDFNYLTPGTQLALPEGEKSEVIAQPPSSGYRR